MNEQMDIKNLFFLIILFFGLYYIFVRKETFENEKDNAESKGCSQKSINENVLYYIFGAPHFVR